MWHPRGAHHLVASKKALKNLKLTHFLEHLVTDITFIYSLLDCLGYVRWTAKKTKNV